MKNNILIRVAVYMSLILILESSVPVFGMDRITDTTDDLVITDIVETDAEDIIVSDDEKTVDVVDPTGVDDDGDDVIVESEIFTLDVNDPEGISENNIASGSYGDVTWVIRDDGTLIVEGTGEFKANAGDEAPWYEWRDSIESAEIKLNGTKKLSLLLHDMSNLVSVDLSGMETSKATDMHRMFWECEKIENLDLSGFDTSNVTFMLGMFESCSSLKALDLSNFDTSYVSSMNSMFNGCYSLKTLNVRSFNTSNVTDMAYIFKDCRSLETLDVSGFDLTTITDTLGMFMNCASLKSLDVSSFNTSNITGMDYMFYGCSSLKTLDVSSFDTSSVEHTTVMFAECENLTKLDLSTFDTSNVTKMLGMFRDCNSLEALDISSFDTSNVTDMSEMFQNCENLLELDLSKFDSSSVTDTSFMLDNCKSLNMLKVPLNLKTIVYLPATYIKRDDHDTEYTELPQDVITSFIIVKKYDVNVLGVTIVDPPAEINVEGRRALAARIVPGNAINQAVTWTSSAPDIASINQSGIVTGISPGTAIITVKTVDGGYTDTCKITVKNLHVSVNGISISPLTKSIRVGEEFDIDVSVTPADAEDKTCTWSSSDETVATVDEKGTVTGISLGEAEITAKTNDGGFEAVCIVTVTKEVENEKEMENGDKIDFEVTDQTGSLKLHVEDTKAAPLQALINADDTLREYKEIEYYDIYLTDENDDEVTGFGKCTVYIPLQSKMIPYKDSIRVVTILDNEIDDSIESSLVTRDGIEFVKFTTPHFTYFAVMCGDFIHNTLNDDNNKKDDNKKDDNGNKSIDTIGGFINTTINDTSKSTTKSSSSGSSSASSSGSSSGSSESSSSGGTVSDILKVETRSSSKTPAYSQVNTSAEAGSLSDKSDKSSDKAGSSRAKDPVPKTGDRKWYK